MKMAMKRMLALVLCLSTLLSLGAAIVPTATAAGSGSGGGVATTPTVTYDFNYQGMLAEVAASVPGGNLPSGGGDIYTQSGGVWTLRQQLVDAMNKYYGQTVVDGVDYGKVVLNYKYAGLKITSDAALTTTTKVQFQNSDKCKGIRAFVCDGDWFAFWIQTPTTGTYELTLSRYLSKFGVEDGSVHILSVDSSVTDVNAAIEAALAISQGYDVSYRKTGTGYSSSSLEGLPPEEVSLGKWTADGKAEHIVVFKADTLQTVNQTGKCNCMYPAKLMLTEIAEPTPASYNFNYQGMLAEVAASVPGGSLPGGGGDLYTQSNGVWTLRQQLVDAMNKYYGQTVVDGVDYGKVVLNYKYAGLKITSDAAVSTTPKVQFQNRTVSKGIRAYVMEGDWFAFYIQTPKVGTYDVKLSRFLSKFGVEDGSVHILPVSAASDIGAALAASQGYDVSYRKTGDGYSSGDPETNGTPAEEVSLGQWTADGQAEHIVVFKADTLQAVNQTGKCNCMYPAVLNLTPAQPAGPGETTPDETIPDETIPSGPEMTFPNVPVSPVYNFDYQNAVTAGGGADLWKNGVLYQPIINKMNQYYGDGTLNYNFAAVDALLNVTFYKGCGLRAFTMEGEWIAFYMRNPGAGVTYNMYLDYYRTKYGTADGEIYIIPAIRNAADMNAAIKASLKPEYLIGTRNYYGSAYSSSSPYQNDASSLVTNGFVGTWTAGSAQEYIIVFKAGKASTGASANMYPKVMTLTTEKRTDGTPEAEVPEANNIVAPNSTGGFFDRTYPAGATEFSFDYNNAVDADGTDRKDGGIYFRNNGAYSDTMVKLMNEYYGSGVLNWNYLTTKSNANLEFVKGYGLNAQTVAGDWIAFTIKNPGAGEYHVYLDYMRTRYGASDSEVYLFPKPTSGVLENEIEKALIVKENLVYSGLSYAADFSNQDLRYHGSKGASTRYMNTFTLGNAAEYVVVFKATANSTFDQRDQYGRMYPSQLILSKEELTDIQPMVDGIVVAEDVSTTMQAQVSLVVQINGHDYLFLIMRDFRMVVFDLDTKSVVDTVMDHPFTLPRYACVDKNGILWVIGMGQNIYRYDPVAKVGENITFDKKLFPVETTLNLYGITAADDGCLYFGTSSSAYIGKYDPQTGEVSRVSEWLNTSDALAPDAYYCGYGGLIAKGDYIYAAIEGDSNKDYTYTHQLIKYSLKENKIVDYVDIAPYLNATNQSGQYRYISTVGDTHIMCSQNSMMKDTVLVDISGSKMKLVKNTGDLDFGAYGYVSKVTKDGKAYVAGNAKHEEGLFEIDIATMKITELSQTEFPPSLPDLMLLGNFLVTIEGDKDLPGESLVATRTGSSGSLELVFYNPTTMKYVVWENFTEGIDGTGNQLRCITTNTDRSLIYVGAYGYNVIGEYSVGLGAVKRTMASYDHQSDGIYYYRDNVYVGNYSRCSITQIDLETGKSLPFFTLNGGAFNQYRCHALTAGEDKIFLGTTPASNKKGGMLVWYDLNLHRTYVAAGPNPEDVYYTNSASAFAFWRRATTGQIMDFDRDNDGEDDDSIIVNGQIVSRFNGLIKDQQANNIIYKDGYIYGSTTTYGGSGSTPDTKNAQFFVYDVKAMKLIATIDPATVLKGFDNQIVWIEAMEEDPLEPGKFWAVIGDTLVSYTFDLKTKTYSFKEEVSLAKGEEGYNGHTNNWDHRNIIFDGKYIYTIFPHYGVYMIDRINPSDCKRLSADVAKQMAMGSDGNLYFFYKTADLQMLPTAALTQKKVAASVQEMINALPATVTEADEPLVTKVRTAYDALVQSTRETIDATKLLEAEKVTNPVRIKAVQKKINALPKSVTGFNSYQVTLVMEEYEKLPIEAQDAMDATKLLAAEQVVLRLRAQKTPYTGDETPIALLTVMLVLSAGAVVTLVVVGKKRKTVK